MGRVIGINEHGSPAVLPQIGEDAEQCLVEDGGAAVGLVKEKIGHAAQVRTGGAGPGSRPLTGCPVIARGGVVLLGRFLTIATTATISGRPAKKPAARPGYRTRTTPAPL